MGEWNICEGNKGIRHIFQLVSVAAVHGGPFKPLSLEAAGLVKIKASFQHEGTAALSH